MALDRNAVQKEAQKFAAKGQFDKAIAEWKKIAKETPNDANVFNTIGDLCLKKNSKPEAVEAYQKAADILAADGFTSKAIALYKKVLNIDAKKIEAHLALADLNAEKGLTGNALESYKIVADHYTQHKDKAKALGIYQKMADLNASNVNFRLKLADMYAKEGMKKEAVKAYLQAADVHVSKDAFKDARQLFEKALALDANNKEVYHKAGLVYFKEGKFVEACKALKPAFEKDPDNAELAELYLDALSKAGRGNEAEEVYHKLLSEQPDRADLREKLYRLYLEQKEYDKAFSEVSTLANSKIENKELDAAEEILKGFVAEAPGSIDGRRALSALYKTVGKADEASAVLVEAARILIENNDSENAQELLAKAVELAPGNDEAVSLLERLQPKPAAAPEPEPEPIQKPTPAAAAPKPKSAAPAPAAPKPAPGPTATPSSTPLLDDPVISEALAEVDVLVKYGLQTKAIEQLEKLSQTNPKNIQIRIKLRDLYADNGNMSKAVSHMVILAELYAEHGMQDRADEVLQAARGMDPNNTQIRATRGIAPQAPALEEALPSLDIGDLSAGLEMAPEGFGEELSTSATGGYAQEQVLDESLSAPGPGEEVVFDQPFGAPGIPDSAFGEQETAAMPETAETFGQVEEQQAPGTQEIDLGEIWAEAEFYYQQGLFDEARKHYEKIIELNPGNVQARDRIAEISKDQEEAQEFSKLAEAVDELEGLDAAGFSGARPAAAQELSTSISDEEAVRSLMQEIAGLKQKASPPQQAPKAPPARPEKKRPMPDIPRPAAPQGADEDFFDLGAELNEAGAGSFSEKQSTSPAGSDDFFDLASELRDELSSAEIPPGPSASTESQSLDDIFEEFKKGVEQQAIKEDADTHYNLGVAYKEMGLLDDAISEFVMTPEDEPKYVQSRYMLGLCYMEKGDYQNAITEIDHALSAVEREGRPLRDRISMIYDLGLAYQGAGNNANAIAQFEKVSAVDPSYRDAGAKIKELQQGGSISLAQLKDDIEKEISSKFLEEGERIEREEKTRKNERVRG